MPWKTLLIIALVITVGWLATMAILSLLARRPEGLGVHDGKLAACPATPNCVCSQAEDAEHAIEPIRFDNGADEAWRRLRQVLAERPLTRIVREEGDYLHAECTSLLFRFTDDVEVLLDRAASVIHLRSASRIGRSDLGANRRRIEEIRQAFAANEGS
jgi:uncharacterized protein (DUF1499 family)